ncbi:hypothetical protein [uncultured Aquimarina sp.]|uniref:hypothetical protein n=1 Tax=uncultured Aquimarina sp. TaxID=575652 RepID=UPI002611519D|nr:hypothetical protein [uncultured Aquimarina sp.]
MQTLKFLLLAVLLGLNLVSCDPPSVNEEVGVEETQSLDFTEDDDDEVIQTPG